MRINEFFLDTIIKYIYFLYKYIKYIKIIVKVQISFMKY